MDPSPTALESFKQGVAKDSLSLMRDLFGEQRAREASQHVAVAFRTLARINPKVAECSRASVAQCLAMCALTRLMPGGAMPGVYLIPRGRRMQIDGQWETVQELNFQIGFRGLLQLAQRAGFSLAAYPVYRGAPVQLDAMGHLVIPDEPQRPERTWDNLVGVVVTIHTIRGEPMGRHFVGVDLIEARRDVSDSWIKGNATTKTQGFGRNAKEVQKSDEDIARDRRSPWFEWPEEMALKTALAYVIRRGYVPLDDVAGEVLAADAKGDTVEVVHTTEASVAIPAAKAGALNRRIGAVEPRVIEVAPDIPDEMAPPTLEQQAAIIAAEMGDEAGI